MRLERINSLLKQEIATILTRRINDQRIGFISITEVKISKDLSLAKVFYSQLGSEEDRKRTKKGLQAARKFIKGEIGRVIKLRTVPDLCFIYDESIERGSRVLSKLNKLASESIPEKDINESATFNSSEQS